MRKLCLCVVSCCFLMFALSAVGQVQNGQFTGTVTDPSGAAIAGAKVTVTNRATNLSVSTTTNTSGAYTVKELPAGQYDMTIESSGFRSYSNKTVTVNAGTITRVDAKMQVGQQKWVWILKTDTEPW